MIKPFANYLSLDQQELLTSQIKQIINKGQYVLGEFTEKLENVVKDETCAQFAKTVSSGTVALELIFEYLTKAGHKKVAVQSNTNFATVSAVVRAGLEVIFIDCDRFGQLCLKDLKSKFDVYHFDACAIVHIGGFFSADLKEIHSFLKQKNIKLIEDCAHAHGTKTPLGPAGGLGYASIFSYFPTKVVNGGEGGVLATVDQDLAEFAHKWRNQGKGGVYGNDHSVLGGSYRMPEINCAIALAYYEILSKEITNRRDKFTYLIDNVQGIEICELPETSQVSFYKMICLIEGKNGSQIEESLKASDVVPGGAVYRKPCHVQPVFSELKFGLENLSGTENFCASHFCPPLHSKISDVEMELLASSLNKIGEACA